MTDQILQGGEVFEITDHTTASDWERFIASLEEILTEWKLDKQSPSVPAYKELPIGSISSGFWREKHDVLKFGQVHFDLRYQYLEGASPDSRTSGTAADQVQSPAIEQLSIRSESSESRDYEDANNESDDTIGSDGSDDIGANNLIPKEKEKEHGEHDMPDNAPECLRDLVATSNDFASKAHCLVRWYNVRKFIILAPRGDTIVSEDRVKLLLSSASIALSNIDCHVPIFVSTHNPRNNLYQGISEHMNYRTMYEMVFFKKNLKQYSYLSELISLFREKTSCNLSDPISVSVRLNYCLSSFELFVSPSEEFSGNEHMDEQDELVAMTNESKQKPSGEASRTIRAQDMRTGASFEQVVEALEDCIPHPFKILRFLHVAALWPPVSDKVITDNQVHSDLDPAEAPIWTIRCLASDNCNMKIVHETQAIYELFSAAIDYAYDKLDATTVFQDCDRETLKKRCLRLSYELSQKPEVILSENPSDSMRKIVTLLFYRAAEVSEEIDALDQIAVSLKKKPSLAEVYRSFNRRHRPSVKEFIVRTQISRPFNPISTVALPQRMFCTICDEEFRLCGAFTELCN